MAKTAIGVVSLVSQLFSDQRQKGGVHGGLSAGFFQSASVFLVGIGLLASPFLVHAIDEEKTNAAPEVSCLWVSNHGLSGFMAEFDVIAPLDSDITLHSFCLGQDGFIRSVDREPAPSATIESEAPKGWLDILGYDGGLPLLLYSGYLHSFDFTIKGGEVVRIGFLEALAPLAGGSSMMRLPKWIFRFTSFSIAKALFTR